jgi:dolichyl-phosphate-mannose--protein O-mannosyl transferase
MNPFHSPFSPDWWVWLTFTGISIGCVASVKWVGLFVTALVGVYTIEDLWDKFGDLRMKKVSVSVAGRRDIFADELINSATTSTTG